MTNKLSDTIVIKENKLKKLQMDFYVRAAIDLAYTDEVLYSLVACKTETEATRIMTTARESGERRRRR